MRTLRVAAIVIIVTTLSAVSGLGIAGASESYSPSVTVDRTGSTDVSAQLQAFFDSVPNGSTITFPAGSTYRIEGTLILTDRKNLTIDGSGATFLVTTDGTNATQGRDHNWWGRSWPRKRGQFVFKRGSGITLTNLTIDGANNGAGAHNNSFKVDLEAQHGIELYGTTDVTIDGCDIFHTYGDPISVSGGSDNVQITNCHVHHTGRQGITVDEGTNVTIAENDIHDIGRSAIDLEPARPDWNVEHITVRNNRIGRANGVFIAAYGNGPVNHITIADNTLEDEELKILVKDAKGVQRHHWTITGNTTDRIEGSPVAPLRFTNVDHILIRNNHVPIASTQSRQALSITGANNVIIEDNDFPIHNTTKVPSRPRTGDQATITVNSKELTQPIRLPLAPRPPASDPQPTGTDDRSMAESTPPTSVPTSSGDSPARTRIGSATKPTQPGKPPVDQSIPADVQPGAFERSDSEASVVDNGAPGLLQGERDEVALGPTTPTPSPWLRLTAVGLIAAVSLALVQFARSTQQVSARAQAAAPEGV